MALGAYVGVLLEAVLAGRFVEAGRRGDSTARLSTREGTIQLGAAELPVPWSLRRTRTYAAYSGGRCEDNDGRGVPQLFHVTSSSNRESIQEHGLDSSRMGGACGIAGSPVPEQVGIFLCADEREVEWFVRMNNTRGTVDVWAVDGVVPDTLRWSPERYHHLPGTIAREQLTLVRQDLPPAM